MDYDKIKVLMDDEKGMLISHFIRHFAAEFAKTLQDANKIAMFREMEPGVQMNCYVQGAMISLSGLVFINLDKAKCDGGDVTKAAVDYLKMSVDIGMTNARIIAGDVMDEAFSMLNRDKK